MDIDIAGAARIEGGCAKSPQLDGGNAAAASRAPRVSGNPRLAAADTMIDMAAAMRSGAA